MRAKIAASLLVLFGLVTPFSRSLQVLNWLCFLLILFGIWRKVPEKITTAVVMGLLVSQVVLSGWLDGGQIKQQLATPLGPEYTTDMRAFLKTYQLMETGQEFYWAFASGMAGLRSGVFHPDINAWRQPFVFYLWKVLPGDGVGIYYFWQLFIIFNLVAGYKIARRFLPARWAIISPFILWPYFHYSLVDLTILQPEWWGLSFFLFGLAFFLYRRFVLAATFFALALACRELFAIPIGTLVILEYKNWRKFTLPLGLFAVYFLSYHLPNIFRFPTEILRTTRNGGAYVIHSLFAYSSWNYVLGTLRPFVILFAVSVLTVLRKKNLILLVSFLPLAIVAGFFSALGMIDETRDYWGIYFVPLLLISAPALILPPGK